MEHLCCKCRIPDLLNAAQPREECLRRQPLGVICLPWSKQSQKREITGPQIPQLHPLSHSQAPMAEGPIQVVFADAPFPQKRGPLSLCVIKNGVSSVEGRRWCLPACLFTLSQNSNPQIRWRHLVSFPNAKALFPLLFVLNSRSLPMLTGELCLRKWS